MSNSTERLKKNIYDITYKLKDFTDKKEIVDNGRSPGQPLSVEQMMSAYPDSIILLERYRLSDAERRKLEAELHDLENAISDANQRLSIIRMKLQLDALLSYPSI